jgi:hypothetical protein
VLACEATMGGFNVVSLELQCSLTSSLPWNDFVAWHLSQPESVGLAQMQETSGIDRKRIFLQEERQELAQQVPQMNIPDVDPTCSGAVASFQQPPKYDRGLANRTSAKDDNPAGYSE